MTSIFVQPEDRHQGTSNFNTWKERVLNILEEHDLDSLVTTMVEEPTTNEGEINFKKNQAKAKHIIFDSVKDNLMSAIIPLNTARECFDTLTNLSKKKALSQEEGRIQSKVVYNKEEKCVPTTRMKKERNPFTTKKLFHSSE